MTATIGEGPALLRPPNTSANNAVPPRTVAIATTRPTMKAGVEVRACGDISSTTMAMIGSGLIDTATREREEFSNSLLHQLPCELVGLPAAYRRLPPMRLPPAAP